MESSQYFRTNNILLETSARWLLENIVNFKVKFDAQKEHEWMTVTFSKVVLYGNNIQ